MLYLGFRFIPQQLLFLSPFLTHPLLFLLHSNLLLLLLQLLSLFLTLLLLLRYPLRYL